MQSLINRKENYEHVVYIFIPIFNVDGYEYSLNVLNQSVEEFSKLEKPVAKNRNNLYCKNNF